MSVITLNSTDRTITPADLVWENPPERKQDAGIYAAVAAALKAKPGQWAVLRTFKSASKRRAWSFASVINSGKLVDFRNTPGGGFEATARTSDDGSVRVYVRYQPGLSDQDAA
ncbi:hypothetical protein [Pseudactinotalea sp. Z1732]|uniref:hypothetical protein n=1 Tax=Micrococcales TaxID=85006 RepID=UPI003C7B7C4D